MNDILYLESIHQIIPQKAAGLPSIGCSMCGEGTMQTRTRESEHGPVCIPCAHQIGLSQPDNHSVHIKPEKLIKSLGLAPLPEEDGLFNEVYRSTETISEAALPNRYSGKRSFSTAIYYMLIPGVVSRKHRVKSDEIFHLYGGGPAKMIQIFADGTRKEFIIGMDIEAGQRPMVIVPAGVWQGMELLPGAAYALFGCTVAPGFDFDDFEM